GLDGQVPGEIQSDVEQVELERGDAQVFHERRDLGQLLPGHDREVIAVVGVGVPGGQAEDLGKDLAVRSGLVHVVAAGPEIGEHRRYASDKRRRCLGPRVLGVRTVDAEVEVRVDGPRENDLVARVYDLFRARRG